MNMPKERLQYLKDKLGGLEAVLNDIKELFENELVTVHWVIHFGRKLIDDDAKYYAFLEECGILDARSES